MVADLFGEGEMKAVGIQADVEIDNRSEGSCPSGELEVRCALERHGGVEHRLVDGNAADMERREVTGQPILFVSGYNETDAIRRVAPEAHILAKPFRASALEQAVRSALEQAAG